MKSDWWLSRLAPLARLATLMVPGLGLVFGALARADEPAAAGARNEGEIFEIVVTAQKRSGERAERADRHAGVHGRATAEMPASCQITDITQLAPNLNVVVQNSLSQHIVIRGVGTNEFFGNAPSSVGTYMDEVTMNSSYMSTLGALRHGARGGAAWTAEQPLRSQHDRRRGQLHLPRAESRSGLPCRATALATYGSHNLTEARGGRYRFRLGSTAALRLAGIYH